MGNVCLGLPPMVLGSLWVTDRPSSDGKCESP